MPPSASSPLSQPSAIPPTPDSDTTACSPQTQLTIFSPLGNHLESSPVVPQKRKAGRKPLYKTAQERRDRNRRAQLAFRARRSDYLARLEDTCRDLEGVVMEMQESNRVANDALNRERSKVKYLERLLQRSSSVAMRQQANPMGFSSVASFSISANDPTASLGTQGVSDLLFSNDLSLISMEQQFSPISQSTNIPDVMFAQNLLGMLPLPIF